MQFRDWCLEEGKALSVESKLSHESVQKLLGNTVITPSWWWL
jgi:hypothetical protein